METIVGLNFSALAGMEALSLGSRITKLMYNNSQNSAAMLFCLFNQKIVRCSTNFLCVGTTMHLPGGLLESFELKVYVCPVRRAFCGSRDYQVCVCMYVDVCSIH